MNRNLWLWAVLAVLAGMSAFGQSRGKLSVTATLSPTYRHVAYRPQFLFPESDGQIVEPVFVAGNRWTPGFTTGLTAHYEYAPGWSVESGFWFQQTGLRQTRPGNDGTTRVMNRIVRIPLLLNFQSSQNRLSPYFSLGLFTDLPLMGRTIVNRTDQPTQRLRLQNDKGPYFHIVAGAGVIYRINERYRVILQPQYAYDLGRFGGYRTHNPAFGLTLLTQVLYTF